MNVNYPLYYGLFQPFIYCGRLLVFSFMKTACINYFGLGKAADPVNIATLRYWLVIFLYLYSKNGTIVFLS